MDESAATPPLKDQPIAQANADAETLTGDEDLAWEALVMTTDENDARLSEEAEIELDVELALPVEVLVDRGHDTSGDIEDVIEHDDERESGSDQGLDAVAGEHEAGANGTDDSATGEVGFRELLEELISQRPKAKEPPKPKEIVASGWDPLMLPAGPRRVRAWWRLVSFVDWINATFGAFRTSSGEAPRWVRAGWWRNPLAVSHLAALECAWASYQVNTQALPMNADGPVRVLLDWTRQVLDLVCGMHSASSQWGLNHERGGNAHFSLQPPPGEPDPTTVREMIEHFIQHEDVEVPERTGFLTGVVAELNS